MARRKVSAVSYEALSVGDMGRGLMKTIRSFGWKLGAWLSLRVLRGILPALSLQELREYVVCQVRGVFQFMLRVSEYDDKMVLNVASSRIGEDATPRACSCSLEVAA